METLNRRAFLRTAPALATAWAEREGSGISYCANSRHSKRIQPGSNGFLQEHFFVHSDSMHTVRCQRSREIQVALKVIW